MLGVMLDCSRNSVITVPNIKKYADILKKMGYDTLMLYTEDTYEIEGEPFFGHLRGRYSKEELKEVDSYCNSIGIELVPCIQTLAHLDAMLKWSSQYGDIHDSRDVMLAGNEKTYNLIEKMFKTLSECFTSRLIHIGMDEAEGVGLGKYLRQHGFQDRFEIINNHLHRVCEIADKYGFKPMIWNDMFVKLALDVEDHNATIDPSKIKEKSALPENVLCVYWDYYSLDYDHYVKLIQANKLFGREVYFAGGIWTWPGFTPANQFSIDSTAVAVKACKDCGVDNMFFTMWGDDGAECSRYSVLPSLLFAAEAAKGNTNMDSIKAKFKEMFGVEYDDFMLLDKFDTIGGKHSEKPSKYLLYNDVFMGMRDFLCADTDGEYYKSLAEEIHNIKEKGDFEILFNSYEKLAEVLSVKATLGIRTRKAYLEKDMNALKKIICDYDLVIEKIKEFHKAYKALWMWENKPHGFDIQDIRLGGLIMRIESCKARLIDLVNGKINEIPELDEPVLTEINGHNHWSRLVSPNIISHLY